MNLFWHGWRIHYWLDELELGWQEEVIQFLLEEVILSSLEQVVLLTGWDSVLSEEEPGVLQCCWVQEGSHYWLEPDFGLLLARRAVWRGCTLASAPH